MTYEQLLEAIEQAADQIRGKKKSALFISVLEYLLDRYSVWMLGPNAPNQIAEALNTLEAGGQWRFQPKDKNKWKKGWRGLSIPNAMIFQGLKKTVEDIVWHPKLATKGAASSQLTGKYRAKMVQFNDHLWDCERENKDPLPDGILGQRERALRIFADEKAMDNMPEHGWSKVKLTRDDLKCQHKPPAITLVSCEDAKKPPIILENTETFYQIVELNKKTKSWSAVVLGDGAKVIGQYKQIVQLAQRGNFDKVLYFGDLDAKGLEIANSLRKKLLSSDITLVLAEELYRIIIESCLNTDAKKANLAGDFETDWIPEFILLNLVYLTKINRRIPQEAFIQPLFKRK